VALAAGHEFAAARAVGLSAALVQAFATAPAAAAAMAGRGALAIELVLAAAQAELGEPAIGARSARGAARPSARTARSLWRSPPSWAHSPRTLIR
jgi:hypothetical protein